MMDDWKTTICLCAVLFGFCLASGCSQSNDACEGHRECSLGEVCSIDGQCKVLSCDQCRGQAELVCLKTDAHPEGVCSRPECRVDGDCSGGTPFCVGGTCNADQCTSDDQCLDGQVCTAFGRCARERGGNDAGPQDSGPSGDTGGDTGVGADSSGQGGTDASGGGDSGGNPSCADVSCSGDQYCDPQTGRCRDSNCTRKKDCSNSPNPRADTWDPKLCACVECRGGGDCSGGKECRGGVCRAPCQRKCNNGSCSGDRPYCISGCCMECVGNSDCGDGEICADGVCKSEAAGCSNDPSSCPPGTSCDQSTGKCEGTNGCPGGGMPSSEICNGQDDDCDGKVDEGLNCGGGCQNGDTRSCGKSTGACRAGRQTCTNGTWGKCQGKVGPSRETCNGQDDDCDGRVDEGNPEAGQQCDTGRTGVCSSGITICRFGSLRCEAQRRSARETCNGKDDDCDGRIDEYVDRRCGKSTGECRKGRQDCKMGQWGPCKGGQGPTKEVCDGDDNDCDGQDDEGLTRNKACQDQKGVCAGATRTCKYGGWRRCRSDEYGPDYESYESSCADGKDNDCDGDVDCRDSISCGGDACGIGQGASCGYVSDTCEEDACYDGKDNDEDGKVDCQDPDCNGCRSGARCDMATGRCIETECDDYSDNDRDGKRNCEDPDCQGKVCSSCYYCGGRKGKTCTNGTCDCTNPASSCP